MAPEASFLNFKCPCTPWMGLYTSGKAAKPLRARNGRATRQTGGRGPAPPGAPQALRTTVHTDPAALGDTHLYVQTHRRRKDQSQQKWAAANRANKVKL